MAGFIKDSDGIWANIVPRIRVDDTGSSSDWRRPTSGWIKTASGWKQWYAGNVADPILSIASTTTTSVTITITNYNAAHTYQNLVSTVGTVSRSTNTITVTGLTAGQSVTVSIRASFLGTPSEITQITTSSSPDQPTFGASSGTTFTQFTIPITNYNSSYTYSITTSAGTQSRSGSDITISGLSGPGASATVSVTATTPQGRSSSVGQTTRSTQALVVPTISATPQLNGFDPVTISNTTGGYTYQVFHSGPRSLTRTEITSSSYRLTGAQPGESYRVWVVGTTDTTPAYSTSAVYTTPDPINTLTLKDPILTSTSTTRSITSTITTASYDSTYSYSWSINPNEGTRSGTGSSSTWTGLTPNKAYTVSVVGSKGGFNTGTANSNVSTLARWTTTGTLATPVSYPGYTLLQFTSSGSIVYNEAINSVRVAVVGGGGAGGSTAASETTWWVASGGGGGGEVVQTTVNEPAATTRTVTLGAGGAVNGANATSSTYGTTTATGGGSARYFVALTNAEWNNTSTRLTAASAPLPTPGGAGAGGSGVVRVTPAPVSGVAGLGSSRPSQIGGSGYFRTDAQSRQGGGGGAGAGPQSSPAGASPNSGTQGGTYWGADFDGGGVGATGRTLWATELGTGQLNSIYAGGGGGGGGATRFGPQGGSNNIHGLAFFGGGGSGSVSNQNGTGSRASTAGTAYLGGGGGGGFNTISTASHRPGSAGGSGTVFILIPN